MRWKLEGEKKATRRIPPYLLQAFFLKAIVEEGKFGRDTGEMRERERERRRGEEGGAVYLNKILPFISYVKEVRYQSNKYEQ